LACVAVWLLAAGCWLLAVGCWLLAVGCHTRLDLVSAVAPCVTWLSPWLDANIKPWNDRVGV
jgi:hypothetical protein